ncbi:hypothetical protein M409DRAFT_66589 [Zasmidium cellare ATCC 36951]|uniref:RhoGAP-domain-containing protein n=1 Tax=Zasmidium cellare ATCC 36951 TaxID=1080233 RepID=A0A6A6CHP6_ZASCE|nr:uncharacterized protein M409DRAFT_66589 [Zasmidium cellare ATCC 36951]KAF2166571.1 hypothetical protein M409DRAFT_66589 [Zasmidium cellare ATCC 36951]
MAQPLPRPGWPPAQHYHSTTTQGPATRAPTTTAHEPPQDSHAASDSRLRSPLIQQSPVPARQPRVPNPAKKVTGKDDIREAITRQAVADEQRAAGKIQSHHHRTFSSPSSPVLAAAPQISPPTSPTVMSNSKAATRPERGPIMAHRTASIDSTVSSISSASQRTANANNAYRVSDNIGPQDAGALITAAGSAEAALQKLIAERQQAASHNAQLWRLVEKQRSMILGLNKDLEKALKENERYRKKLKEQLAQSTSAPSLITSVVGDGPDSQEASPSPSHMEPPSDMSRDISVDTRKTSNSSEAPGASGGRSDTPQDAAAHSSGLPATPQSANSLSGASREFDRVNTATAVPVTAASEARPAMAMAMSQRAPTTNTPPMSPKLVDTQSPKFLHGHSKSMSNSSLQTSPPASTQYYSSPKTRKAPPAPLKLDAPKADPSIMNNIVDASDSEYEDDPESARSEYIDRGRRKTREDDDREREALVRQEDEQRSRSKKEKKSKSRPSGDKIEVPTAVPQLGEQIVQQPTREAPRQPPIFITGNPAEIVRSRAVSDASGMLQRNNTAPSLMSPGLPMSPRPGDRPPNSPMPRQTNAATSSIPMSPKAGLPLSPRAPRSAIPLPPQTPLAMISPHLDRAKAYHQQMHPQPQPVSAVVDRLKPSPDATPDRERPSTSSDPVAYSPGEIYRGLTTEQYPDLLLPPNALPSIYVKTASSRMRPSRASFIAPKHADENPVFILAVHSRSDNLQLWRVEKTYASLAVLDQQVKSVVTVRDRLPEKALFTGHAPAKIDARRLALNHYFDRMLDSVTNDKPAMFVCKFLSSDAIGGEGDDYFGANLDGRPESPASALRPNRAGYLTKRGKNFGGWKARYFVLDGPNLKYFEGPGGAHLGSIKLQNAQIGKQSSNASQGSSDDEENQFRHAFLILEPKKKDSSSLVRHVLCAESDDERDAWVEALLQYVDYKDDEEPQAARQAQIYKTEISAPRSPRLQRSMNDLRPSSDNSKDPAQSKSIDQVRTVNYNETVAGEAPIMGPPASPRVPHTPSPPYDKLTVDAQPSSTHLAISAPTNVHVIQNSGDWGKKPPPTPGLKDKKRSMFSGLPFSRGRSSSDLATNDSAKTPSAPPQDRFGGGRVVFGIPLAEAVAVAHPADATTELPAVVYRCLEYLHAKNAVGEEGIFRVSGSNIIIRQLKDRFNNEGDINLLTDENQYEVNAVASVLKMYLRELPASILTRDLHIDFLKCLEIEDVEKKILKVNALVHKLPTPNRALLDALSSYMVCIVDNVEQNKMTVRNLGVVFSPTLNLPGPLISLFIEEQHRIFSSPLDSAEAPQSPRDARPNTSASSTDLRSPRKQMFSDLPTPSYNQTQFQSMGGHHAEDTGMIPMHPSYSTYQMAPQGDGGYGSLNDVLRSPTVYGMTGTGAPTPRDIKASRRESGMLAVNSIMGPTKKSSASKLRDDPPTSF